MESPTLYRNRLIPRESIPLVNDLILSWDEKQIVTSWKALHPRPTLAYGYSLYLPALGYKISRFYGHEGQFLYWYCDIIQSHYDHKANAWYFTDLLVDVIIQPDGFVKILDLDELNIAYNKGLITLSQLQMAIDQLHSLLQVIYNGEFESLTENFMKQITSI